MTICKIHLTKTALNMDLEVGLQDVQTVVGLCLLQAGKGKGSQMSKVDEMLKTIEKYGMQVPGTRHLIRHLEGEIISRGQAMVAKCADCMGYYADGRRDCKIPECPMYHYMPYGEKKGVKAMGKVGKPLSEKQKAKMKAGRLSKHAKV